MAIGCFGHVFNDVKSAELALVPCSKIYHSIIYTEQGTSDINFDLLEAIWMGPEHF